ncbi:hypothetical protein SSYM_1089 [Serratia symbiotica str. Tucson]|uniref:DUF937 domain-containing protein n=2 Tax=Serratia symbiotica TaxID=138074 RepID=E9CLH3_9GAMM|nr:YidB family protein [Serratia symbiotica]EFW12485.1 hypothetical protein SSYM_1089 [Serratia symbiotica str. Tucson]BBI91202.1 uncharacterized protein SSYIS1_02760 [Serratia symbiotica]
MGLLNSVLGNILGGASSKGIDYAAIMQWVEQQGGLQAILDKFRHGQFGDVVGSWLSNGKNQQISGDHVQQVLGSDAINQLAEKLGVDPAQACSTMQSFCLRWLTPHHPTVKCSRMATYWGIWSASYSSKS